jgi:creatinine amidohydrolase/Fe(II)-dependent formamide hydrolase-like protein
MTSANISTSRLLGNLRAPQIAHALNNTAIIVQPLGAIEQHGPHLPLDTDTQIATHLCAQATTGMDNVVVAPPLSITASGEHAGFPGTISIGTEAFATVIVELVRSCDWATGVILVHGHGGNFEAVRRATAMLNSEQRNNCQLVATHSWRRRSRRPHRDITHVGH